MGEENIKKEKLVYEMEMNPVARFLKKQPQDFTKEDVIRFIHENKVEIINLCYPGDDGRLKKLNFPVKDYDYVNLILETGERVDGSNLFPYIDLSNSDIYVIPRYRTAFVDPFSRSASLNLMCTYFDNSGKPLDICPHNIVDRVSKRILQDIGITLKALGELEYYVIINIGENIYPSIPERNYHEAAPFVKGEDLREEILTTLSRCGIRVKYAHSEVGDVPSRENKVMEQHEIELLLEPIEDMSDYLTISKWVIRNVAAKWGVLVTFAPKIEIGHAGSGLHIHLCAEKDRKSIMIGDDGELSLYAKQMIGGLLKYAKSISAFGNAIPTSFFRLVPKQEAPTKICWGERNRTALIRVPLGWKNVGHMAQILNYGEERVDFEPPEVQTFEIRSPDGSAHPYHLLSALGSAIHWGLTNPDAALKIAENLYLEGNLFEDRTKGDRYDDLPASCAEAAKYLEKERVLYEEMGLPPRLIKGVVKKLRGYGDENIYKELDKDPEKMKSLLGKYIHCG